MKKANPALKELNKLEQHIEKLNQLNLSFNYAKLNLASAEQIRKWAERRLPKGKVAGKVSSPETLNYRGLEPETSGLFCQKIFGPINDWKCRCGKYSGVLINKICEKCGVELTETRVRRYRMGYIDLNYSCAHFWYIKGAPNYLTLILQSLNPFIGKEDVEEILYFYKEGNNIDANNPLFRYSKFSNEPFSYKNSFGALFSDIKIKNYRQGTELLLEALSHIDLKEEAYYLRNLNYLSTITLPKALIRKLRIFENFIATNTKLSALIFAALPILPPTLRPLVEIADSKLVNSDANEFYKNIITRNLRFVPFDEDEEELPDFMSYLIKTHLQESVDCLIDNARLPELKIFSINDRPLKSLTEALEGKEGRFRQTLLGKRVDYSARSVIIAGPTLRLNQCGLPYDIAAKLFEAHLINFLLKTKASNNSAKFATLIIKRRKLFVWRLLEKLLEKNCILLNRAPTLHRFGIQAFNPVLILGKAIQLHPLVCTGFNADFDGDQMAVHLPLYESSQLESHFLMRPSSNILSPANGDVILKPTQDMVIGSYYVSLATKNLEKNIKKYFASEDDALSAFYSKKLNLHDTIFVKYSLKNKLKLEKNKVSWFQELESLNQKKINYFGFFCGKKFSKKLYIITNLGIIVAHVIRDDAYILKDLYLETTAGRLVFANNIKKVFTKLDL